VKQCWRILYNPDSLVAKILKAKYYPYGSIIDAKFEYRKVICSSCDLLKDSFGEWGMMRN
jgi:hypothetical protein